MNPNFINTLEIENFKSILDSGKIECNRINVFVGRPNVGKSNILEGVSLLKNYKDSEVLFEGIRHEKISDFFYKKEIKNRIILTNDDLKLWLAHNNSNYSIIVSNLPDLESLQKTLSAENMISVKENNEELNGTYTQFIGFDDDKKIAIKYFTEKNVRKKIVSYYLFKKDVQFKDSKTTFLYPPFGSNLLNVIETNSSLRKEITSVFKEFDLMPLINKEDQKFSLIRIEDGIGITYPYILMADTLQRYLFHLAAIESNENSIILFEEPEAHCYYEYVQRIAEKIIESETNQFFLTTHSPDILLPLLENDLKNEVSVFHVTYSDEQTKISKLSDTRLREMMDSGASIMANLENFDITA